MPEEKEDALAQKQSGAGKKKGKKNRGDLQDNVKV